MRIGLFGGSFNPIHYGHIRLARQLLALAALDEVWFVVSPQNPLKQQTDLLDDDLRLQMVEMALQREKGLRASDIEFRLPRPSYTWNTLEALTNDYPERQFVLMIGGDNWAIFDKWYRADDIKQKFEIIVYTRTPGDPGFIDISSTAIRQRIRQGKDISRMVPKTVADYIKENGLYA